MKARGFRFIGDDLFHWDLPGPYALLARDAFTLVQDIPTKTEVSDGAEEAFREAPGMSVDKYNLEFTVPVEIAKLEDNGTLFRVVLLSCLISSARSDRK